tara:strand:- start:177 stop:935 length:759 start_codon:yes stop_codon:yes gene_type:complete
MNNLLPSQTGLTVEGIFHRYTLTKDATKDSTVSITNKKINGDGYIYEYIDDWNKIPGGTKVTYDAVPSTLGNLFGNGEIKVTGDGSLSDVTILYHYKFDPCHTPLSDPTCPDFQSALYQYLLDNNLLDAPNVEDPFYNQWVQIQLDEQAETEKQEAVEVQEEEENEELSVEEILSVAGAAEKIADPMQQLNMMQQIAAIGKLELYYNTVIDGGVYKDNLIINGGTIEDNFNGLRNLAQDSVHRGIVRSQYDD